MSRLQDQVQRTLEEQFDAIRADVQQVKGLVADAMAKVQRGFDGLSRQIQAQDRLIHTMIDRNGTAGESGERDLMAFTGEISDSLARLSGHVVDVGRSSAEVSTRIDGMVDRMNDVQQLVRGVKRVSDQTNLLALNAQIEAARAGEAGLGFAVVAKEVKTLSQSSNDLSDRIEEGVARARAEVLDAQKVIGALATEDTEAALQARSRVDGLLEEVARVNRFMGERLEEAAQISREIVSGISVSVTALQFEDIVGQLVAHIDERVALLAPLVEDVVELRLQSVQDGAGPDPVVVERLEAALRGHLERLADREHKAVKQASMDNGSVELF